MTAMIGDRSPGTGLASHDPQAAAFPSPLDGPIPGVHLVCVVAALLLEAIACDAPGHPDAARRILERAVDAAEHEHLLFPFPIHPARPLSGRHATHRTAPATLISEVEDLL